MVSSFFYGTIHSAFFSLMAVYATYNEFYIIRNFNSYFLLAMAQLRFKGPIGNFSDKLDRRKV